MVRLCILLNFNTEISQINPLFQYFYKIQLSEVGEIPPDLFHCIKTNPAPTELLEILKENNLILVIIRDQLVGYLGIVRDVFSREGSIQIPMKLTWNEFLECARQTSKSPIRFK